jgi:hypothetical protein
MVGTGGDELEAELAVVCGRLNRLSARLVGLVAEALECEGWAGAGIRSPEHWLVLRAGLSPGRARQVVLMARRVRDLPVVMGVFEAGSLSVDQVAVVARHAPSHVEASVAELAVSASVPQLGRVLSRYAFDPPTGADPDPEPVSDPGPEPEPADAAVGPAGIEAVESGNAGVEPELDEVGRAGAPAELSMGTRQGRFELRFSAPADAGALVEAAVAEARDALFAAGTPEVTGAGALLEVCGRSLGAVESVSRRDSFWVYVHLDAEGGWLNGRPRLPGHLVAKLTCEGTLQPLWERAGVPVSVGRALRIVPERTRRLVLDRDRGCRFPGCVATAHLQVHDVVHWAHGGRTDLDNLVALCPFHHDAHHAGEFGIRGDANVLGGLVFTARGGFPIGPGPLYAPAGRDRNDRDHDRERNDDHDRDNHDCDRDDHDRDDGDDDRGDDDGDDDRGDDDRDGAGRQDEGWNDWQAATALEYPGATGEVLQGKWVTFCERPPVPA